MKVLLLTLLIGLAISGPITMDRDIDHGHGEEFYSKLQAEEGLKKLKVHIVPHSHEDVGWKLTPDEYFSGFDWAIKPGASQYVLSTVYESLMDHPDRKFTWVESYFFEKWWFAQTEEVKENVKQLIKEGRFTFVNGGWSMSDEATLHYEDFINNMKAGHDFLQKELGYKPTIGWQIDTFGHQSATAGLFAEMGFSSWFISRADIQDKKARLANKEMEYLWRPFSESLGARAEIFTHFTYQHYDPPQGFNYNDAATDEPVIADILLETYNVDDRAEKFRDYLTHMAEHYRTEHLFVLFGDDFGFANSQRFFKNLDLLMDYMNEYYDDMELFYSTPYDYIDAVHSEDLEWPVKYDDHLPYSDMTNGYWTGFYTSRTSIKGYVREASQDLNSQSIFLAMDYLMNGEQTFSAFDKHFKQLSVLVHHDAITGTENQRVADYYMMALHKTHSEFKDQFLKSFENVFQTGLENLSMCKLRNSTFSECPTKDFDQEMVVVILNEENDRTSIAQVPVPHSQIKVIDEDGDEVQSDILCEEDLNDGCTLYFRAEMEAFTVKFFTLKHNEEELHLNPNIGKTLKVEGQNLTVTELAKDGVHLEYTREGSDPEKITLAYKYYDSYDWMLGQKSGAYVFRPLHKNQRPKNFNSFESFEVYDGEIVNQIRISGDEVDTVLTLVENDDFVKVETHLKGIPKSKTGKEVVLQLKIDDFNNNDIFYTDSMGMEMQERKLNYRQSWNLNVDQPIAGNYYPINHAIAIKDEEKIFEVLNDRSQGGSSLEEGEIEIMIQRRTYKDDSRGVHEALNEVNPESNDERGIAIDTTHYFRVYSEGSEKPPMRNSRVMQKNIDVPLSYMFGTRSGDSLKKSEPLLRLGDVLNLPEHVKAVFLPEENGSLFLRLENVLDLISASDSATVNVSEVAKNLASFMKTSVSSIQEVSNTGLYTMEEMNEVKLHWKGLDFTNDPVTYASEYDSVTFEPQRIRSFIITFNMKLPN